MSKIVCVQCKRIPHQFLPEPDVLNCFKFSLYDLSVVRYKLHCVTGPGHLSDVAPNFIIYDKRPHFVLLQARGACTNPPASLPDTQVPM